MKNPQNEPVLISLITGTAGRTDELSRLGLSLTQQTTKKFEWIVVDQNSDARINAILDTFRAKIEIKHLRCEPNLSNALNLGVQTARAKIVGFPDDDGWLDPDALKSIIELFLNNPQWAGIACKVVDAQGNQSISSWHMNAGPCNRFNAWPRIASTGLYFRRDIFLNLGGFDTTLGLGINIPIAGHDLDLVLRAIKKKLKIQYTTEPVARHPKMHGINTKINTEKVYQYAVGAGRLMREHRMPIWWVASSIALPLFRSCRERILGNSEKARTDWLNTLGRFRGWLGAGGGRRTILGSSQEPTLDQR